MRLFPRPKGFCVLFEFYDFFLSPIASNRRDECLQYGLDTDLRAFVGAVENPIYGFVARVPPYSVFVCFPVSFAAYFGQVDYFCFRHAVTSVGSRRLTPPSTQRVFAELPRWVSENYGT